MIGLPSSPRYGKATVDHFPWETCGFPMGFFHGFFYVYWRVSLIVAFLTWSLETSIFSRTLPCIYPSNPIDISLKLATAIQQLPILAT
jgi:hypothetical protein